MNYFALSEFILRTPVSPIGYRTHITGQNGLINEELKKLFKDPALVESFFIASPEFYEEMIKWIAGISKNKKEEDRLLFSLIKYLSRMETRPTPFGLFSGCKAGKITEKTSIEQSPEGSYSRHTRLDMNFLCALSQDLASLSEVKTKLQFFPNNSLYKVGDKYRYVEYHYLNAKRIHRTVSIDNTIYIDLVIEQCTNGAYYYDLVKCVEGDEISHEEAVDFIEALIDNQVIVNELEPSTTGPEQLDYIIDVLDKIKVLPDLVSKLKDIGSRLQKIDKVGLGNSIDQYYDIINIIKEIGTSYDKKFLFQTDLKLNTHTNTISGKIPDAVKKGIIFLSKFNYNKETSNLVKFRENFYDRYEDLEVSLAEALDTEMGIGYGDNTVSSGDVNPLVDSLRISGKKGQSAFEMRWDVLQSFLLKKYMEAIKDNLYEVHLTDKEIETLEKDLPSSELLADTFSVMIEVSEADPVNDNYKILLKGIGGTTGAFLLGRFCHGDSEIRNIVNQIVQIENEKAGDGVQAEIVHLPESRTGNVLLRPEIRKYEIPYLSRGSVDHEFQLKLDDLFVSVKNDRIILRSKKLNKIILPRLSNAHNFTFNALPVYQFLCDLQYQGISGGVGFSWGSLANEYPFLPRITYDNLILSPARWNVRVSDIKKYFEIPEEDKLLEQIRAWRQSNHVPQIVLLSDGDNELFIDLEIPLYIKILWGTIKSRVEFKLEEFLYNPQKPLVTGSSGWYANELILIFKTEKISK